MNLAERGIIFGTHPGIGVSEYKWEDYVHIPQVTLPSSIPLKVGRNILFSWEEPSYMEKYPFITDMLYNF